MALTVKEFLELVRLNPPQEKIQKEMRRQEEAEDEYFDELGELMEKHPPLNPRIFRK
mgnify:CR=1 FL=1